MTQDSHDEKRRKHMAVMDDKNADWQSEAMHQNKLLHDALTRIEEISAQLKTVLEREAETQVRHDSKIDALEAKLAKAVEDAFCEGFAEGYDGTWVEGDYTHAWKKSHALANLEKAK